MNKHRNTNPPNRHIAHIDAVNALARLHYRRIKDAGSSMEGAASALRALPTLLRHLRQEANDDDSVLNHDTRHFGVARHLHPLIEQTNLVLHELGEVLDLGDKVHKDTNSRREDVDELHRETTRIEQRIVRQKLRVQEFLDEVQLRSSPPPIPPKVAIDDDSLDNLKDRLDAIAVKLFKRRSSNLSETDDDMWEQFCVELERDGFDWEMLKKNKEIIRAYIRSLETSALDNNGHKPPTVRGMLEKEQHALSAPPLSPMASPTEPNFSAPKALTLPFENQKPPPSPPISHGDGISHPCLPKNSSMDLSFDSTMEDNVSNSSGSEPDCMALSTRDLLELDRNERIQKSLVSPMKHLNLYPPPPQFSQGGRSSYTFPIDTSTQPHYSASSSFITLPPSSPPSSFTTGSPQNYPIPPAGTTPVFPPPSFISAIPPDEPVPRLAPDSRGHEIPIDATWTRVKRSLVSPQVLEEAGVRYEARPTFVAILGTLSRQQISEFARKTAEVRAARHRMTRRSRTHKGDRHRTGQKERCDREVRSKTHETKRKEDDIWDEESDTSSDCSTSSSGDEHDAARPAANESRRRTLPLKSDLKEARPRYSSTFVITPANSEKGQTSPTATTTPKPILKNKNENRVHFGRNGPFEIPGSTAESPREEYGRRRRDGHRARDHDHEREREKDKRPRDRDRERDRDRDRRDRDRERDRDHRDYRHSNNHRDRDRDRSRDRWTRHTDLIRAAGIGGAAASLLGVLAEAAIDL